MKALNDGANSTGRVALRGTIRMLTKALTNVGAGGSGDTPYDVQAQRVDGLFANPRRSLALLDVLPSLPIGVGQFQYTQLGSAYTNAADYQLTEGAQKATAVVPTALATANVATIAVVTTASNQVLADQPALINQVSSLLSFGVLSKLEGELLNSTGGAGKIHGLIPQATAYAATATHAADKIGQAVTQLQTLGYKPGLIVLSPADAFALASERSTTGEYLLGPPTQSAPKTLWNTPVALSASMPADEALVLDPTQLAVLDREEVNVQASSETGNNFVENLTTLRAEGRYALAVFSPGAVLLVSLASS